MKTIRSAIPATAEARRLRAADTGGRGKPRSAARICAAALCALLAALPLSGCLQYRELKQESIVMGMGIDKNPAGGYLLTFQIYKPQQSGGGGGGESKSPSSSVTILQSTGATVFEAVRNATLQVGRAPYFSNNRAYVLGEEVCREGIRPVLDFMERNQQINPSEHIFMAAGEAADILTYKKDGETVPATNLDMMAQNSSSTSRTVSVQLLDLYRNTSNGVTDCILPLAALKEVDGKATVSLDGSAVFRNDILAGTLNESETRGVLWVTGKVKGGVVTVTLPQGGYATLEIYKAGSETQVSSQGGVPLIRVGISLTTGLSELHTTASLTMDQSFKNTLIALQNAAVRDEAGAAVRRALQECGSDVFDFGMRTYQNQPELWRSLADKWNTGAKPAQVDIRVSSDLTHFGNTLRVS